MSKLLMVGTLLIATGACINLALSRQTLPGIALTIVGFTLLGTIAIALALPVPVRPYFDHTQSLPDIGAGHCGDCKARVWFAGETNATFILSGGKRSVAINHVGHCCRQPYRIGNQLFRSPVAAYAYALICLGASGQQATRTADSRYHAAMECNGGLGLQ
jgi:hypothetical protein